MNSPLRVDARPCPTCPYRTDCPSGLWAATEYEKLKAFDEMPGRIATFLCHQSNATGTPTVCRGWAITHGDGAAVRIALAIGELPPHAVEPTDIELWPTGRAAAEHGLAELAEPGPAARAKMASLARRGVAR